MHIPRLTMSKASTRGRLAKSQREIHIVRCILNCLSQNNTLHWDTVLLCNNLPLIHGIVHNK